MKFAIVLVVLAVLHGSSAQTAKSVLDKMTAYANGISPQLVSGLGGNKQKFKDAIINQNTLLVNNAKSVINNLKDPIKNKLSVLYKAKNTTVINYANMVNAKVNSTVALMDTLTTSISKMRVTFQETIFPTVDMILSKMTTFISDMLTSIKTGITDQNLKIAKAGGCRNKASNDLNNIFIQFGNDMRACAAGYTGPDTLIRNNLDQTYKNVQAAVMTALNNVTLCQQINKLGDAVAIDATTNCTRTSMLLCIDLGTNFVTYFQSNFTSQISSYEERMDTNIASYDTCLKAVPDKAISAANIVVNAFIDCDTTA